ncbi:MAG: DegV family protein [Oscillospiraceae bacterium]|nr:DegV family protein [Oscillospiraceae bacterium]
MTKNIILVAETGSDTPKELAQQLGIVLIPMHVSMGGETFDDGTFPPEDVCSYYDKTGKIPTTSGSTVYDFESVFDSIFQNNPNAQILYLAYSAVTTCSYHSAELAIEGKPYKNNVRLIDTKQVSVGQCSIVLAVNKWLENNPNATLDEAAHKAQEICKRTQMCFVPKNLKYLRAGGRCSNAAALIGNLLQLHPCIEIIDGKLVACKKYRGSMGKTARALLHDFDIRHKLDREQIYFINTPYMEDEVRTVLNYEAAAMGFKKIIWIKTGCVITCHGGPGAFGIVGIQ